MGGTRSLAGARRLDDLNWSRGTRPGGQFQILPAAFDAGVAQLPRLHAAVSLCSFTGRNEESLAYRRSDRSLTIIGEPGRYWCLGNGERNARLEWSGGRQLVFGDDEGAVVTASQHDGPEGPEVPGEDRGLAMAAHGHDQRIG